ncbi:MAG: IreB family regulatory phosphoprotein [Lachnospiraceae bacterium]|nr:IreB family regulatory phosphoprotein [Lachnospiraceae bacterium]
MEDLTRTQFIQLTPEDFGEIVSVKDVLTSVYAALTEKGYNPVSQIVGYIMSGDPTYITSHKGARAMIMKVERDELVEELLKTYIVSQGWSSMGKF